MQWQVGQPRTGVNEGAMRFHKKERPRQSGAGA